MNCTIKAYNMGVDYAKNGANTTNCNFRLFANMSLTKAWEHVRDDTLSKIKKVPKDKNGN